MMNYLLTLRVNKYNIFVANILKNAGLNSWSINLISWDKKIWISMKLFNSQNSQSLLKLITVSCKISFLQNSLFLFNKTFDYFTPIFNLKSTLLFKSNFQIFSLFLFHKSSFDEDFGSIFPFLHQFQRSLWKILARNFELINI